MKKCSKCYIILDSCNKANKNQSNYCDTCSKEYAKQYRKKYYQQNKEKVKASVKLTRNYHSKQLRTNSLSFRIGLNMKSRMYTILKNKGFKKDKKMKDILGCSYTEFIIYMESKFLKGMTWENHSLYGWHIDHIIPLSSGKTQEEIQNLCHYTNLQPLWAKDNLKKHKKV